MTPEPNPNGLDAARAHWARERASWPAAIAHAAKRHRLGLNLHSPLGTPKDPYTVHLTDKERDAYLAACLNPRLPQDIIWKLRAAVADRLPDGTAGQLQEGK